jgi:O-antigen ligase
MIFKNFENKFVLKLWIIVFITFPLLSLEILRIEIGTLKIPIFFILLLILPIITIINRPFTLNKLNNDELVLIILFLVFLTLHFLNSLKSIDYKYAMICNLKLLSSFLVFLIITLFFPIEIIEKVLKIIILSSSILLSIYLYHYYFELNAPFLSIEWDQITEHGKNMLGLYLSIVTPIILWDGICNNLSLFRIFSLLIHILAIFYSLSRGSLISFLTGFIITITLLILKKEVKIKIKNNNIKKYGISIIIILGTFFYCFSFSHFNDIFKMRLQSLISLEDYDKTNSIEIRKNLINDCIILWQKKLLTGIGTENYFLEKNIFTHNDYLQILCEQGLIGFLTYILFLIIIIKVIIISGFNKWTNIGLSCSMFSLITYSLFLNSYTSIIKYIIIGLLLKSVSIKRK